MTPRVQAEAPALPAGPRAKCPQGHRLDGLKRPLWHFLQKALLESEPVSVDLGTTAHSSGERLNQWTQGGDGGGTGHVPLEWEAGHEIRKQSGLAAPARQGGAGGRKQDQLLWGSHELWERLRGLAEGQGHSAQGRLWWEHFKQAGEED